MNRDPYPLPSAQELVECLEMPLDEAEALLGRMEAKQQRKRFPWPQLTLVEMLFVVAITGILAAVLFPTPCGSRECSKKASCLSNVKQLANALLMYAEDYDDQLPPAIVWTDAVFPYVKNEQISYCPSRKVRDPAYSYNALLHLGRFKDISAPADLPLVFESTLGKRNASDVGSSFYAAHGKRGTVGYADGHVNLMPALPAPDAGLKHR